MNNSKLELQSKKRLSLSKIFSICLIAWLDHYYTERQNLDNLDRRKLTDDSFMDGTTVGLIIHKMTGFKVTFR